MRNYARFTTSMYRDEDFRALTIAQQGVYFLLSLQPEMSAAGTLSLTLRRWANMADDLTPDTLRAELKAIEGRGHIVVDDDVEELLIVKFIKWDGGIQNEKRRPVIREAASAIASQSIRHAVAREMASLGHADMASELAPSLSYPQTDSPPDMQPGFDRSVVKQGDQIPHSSLLTPHSNSTLPESGPPEAACPIPPGVAGPPSMFCSKHPNGTEAPCGPCGSAKAALADWNRRSLESETTSRRSRREAIAACQDCDDRGMRLHPSSRLPVGRCTHQSAQIEPEVAS